MLGRIGHKRDIYIPSPRFKNITVERSVKNRGGKIRPIHVMERGETQEASASLRDYSCLMFSGEQDCHCVFSDIATELPVSQEITSHPDWNWQLG